MVAGNAGRRIYQIGKQSALGTAVTTTSLLDIPSMDWDTAGQVIRPRFMTGRIARNSSAGFVNRRAMTWAIPEHEWTYDTIHRWAAMAVEPGQSPATSGSAEVWQFDYDPESVAGAPPVDLFTIDRRMVFNSGALTRGLPDCFANEFTMAGSSDTGHTIAVRGHARRPAAAVTFTEFAPAALVPAPWGNVSIHRADTWDDLVGETGTYDEIGDVCLGYSLRFGSGAIPLWTAEHNDNLEWTDVVLNRDEALIELTLSVLAQPGASGIYVEERDFAEAGTARFMRVKIEAGAIAGGGAGELYTVEAIMSLEHEPETYEKIGEVDGQDLIEMSLRERPGDSGDPMFRMNITNTAADLT